MPNEAIIQLMVKVLPTKLFDISSSDILTGLEKYKTQPQNITSVLVVLASLFPQQKTSFV